MKNKIRNILKKSVIEFKDTKLYFFTKPMLLLDDVTVYHNLPGKPFQIDGNNGNIIYNGKVFKYWEKSFTKLNNLFGRDVKVAMINLGPEINWVCTDWDAEAYFTINNNQQKRIRNEGMIFLFDELITK